MARNNSVSSIACRQGNPGIGVVRSAGVLVVACAFVIAAQMLGCHGTSPTSPSSPTSVTSSISPVPIRAEAERLGGSMNRYRLNSDLTFRAPAGVAGRITGLTLAIRGADGHTDLQTIPADVALPVGGTATYRMSQTVDAPAASPPQRLLVTPAGVDQKGQPLQIQVTDAPVVCASAATGGPFNHVFIVVEENQGQEKVIGNPQMPYLNSLASQYGLAAEYYANAHPSIGNYFMLTAGRIVTTSDSFAGVVTDDNIVRRLIASGLTWKSYAEDLPSVGYTGGDVGQYARRHNVFAFFDDVVNSPTQVKNLVPFGQFAADLAENLLPNYAFIVPNLCNDGHDCPLSTADLWLQMNIGPLVNSSQFQRDGLLIITYDEADDADTRQGGGRVAWIAVSAKSRRGFRSSVTYQHQSTLRLTAQALGLTTFPNLAAAATDMREFFLY